MAEMPSLEVEQAGDSTGHCACCGRTSRTVWGYVHEADGPTLAAYFVRWTDGHIEETGANVDLVLGGWGDGTSRAGRACVSLLHRQMEDGKPSLMIVDAKAEPEIADKPLKRCEVIGTPLADQVFRLADAIYEQDDRFF